MWKIIFYFKKFLGYHALDNTTNTNNDFPNLSQLFAFYGQFVAHDMVDTSTTTGLHLKSIYISIFIGARLF